MQRQRETYNKSKDSYSKTYDYPISGHMSFEVEGYVQSFKENQKLECDYVMFNIEDLCGDNCVHMISVSVPWNLCADGQDNPVELEKGDHVLISGYMRSWWNEKGCVPTYSFEAQYVKILPKEEETSTRRRSK